MLTHPQAVHERLEELDKNLAMLQNTVEEAAFNWFMAKRERERAHASAFLTAKGSIAARHAIADVEVTLGVEEEAIWEAKRALLKVLETRSNVAMAILKSQGRS